MHSFIDSSFPRTFDVQPNGILSSVLKDNSLFYLQPPLEQTVGAVCEDQPSGIYK